MPVEHAIEEATSESCCCLERDEQSRPSTSEGSDDAEERDRKPCRRSAAQAMPVSVRSKRRPVRAAAASGETNRADRAPVRVAMMPRSASVNRAVEVQHNDAGRVERAVEEATGESCCCFKRDERADRAPARVAMMPRSTTVHRAVEVQHKRCR